MWLWLNSGIFLCSNVDDFLWSVGDVFVCNDVDFYAVMLVYFYAVMLMAPSFAGSMLGGSGQPLNVIQLAVPGPDGQMQVIQIPSMSGEGQQPIVMLPSGDHPSGTVFHWACCFFFLIYDTTQHLPNKNAFDFAVVGRVFVSIAFSFAV